MDKKTIKNLKIISKLNNVFKMTGYVQFTEEFPTDEKEVYEWKNRFLKYLINPEELNHNLKLTIVTPLVEMDEFITQNLIDILPDYDVSSFEAHQIVSILSKQSQSPIVVDALAQYFRKWFESIIPEINKDYSLEDGYRIIQSMVDVQFVTLFGNIRKK